MEQQRELQKVRHSKLKILRFEYGLSQEEMAELIGMSTCTYRDTENGVREVKPSEGKRIKEKFNLDSVEEIFFDWQSLLFR